jgi:hypothetical protein
MPLEVPDPLGAMGAVLLVVLGGITKSSLAAGWVPGVRDVLVPAVLLVAFGFQVGALVLAGRDPAWRRPGVLGRGRRGRPRPVPVDWSLRPERAGMQIRVTRQPATATAAPVSKPRVHAADERG